MSSDISNKKPFKQQTEDLRTFPIRPKPDEEKVSSTHRSVSQGRILWMYYSNVVWKVTESFDETGSTNV